MKSLTSEQQQLVADNHNLIYGYCLKHKLDREEYYSDCALALCYAAQHYDPSKGSFGTYAYLCMNHQIIKSHASAICKKRTCTQVSIDEKTLGGQGYRLEELLPDESDADESWLTGKAYYQEAIGKLSAKERELLSLMYSGYSMREIGERFGVTRACISLRLIKIKNKVKQEETA